MEELKRGDIVTINNSEENEKYIVIQEGVEGFTSNEKIDIQLYNDKSRLHPVRQEYIKDLKKVANVLSESFRIRQLAGIVENFDTDLNLLMLNEVKKEAGVELPTSNLILYGKDKDSNGNSIVKVSFINQRAFSIQTNQEGLFKTKGLLNDKKVDDLTDRDKKTIEKEIVNYIKNHGSSNQKNALKTNVEEQASGEKAPEEKKNSSNPSKRGEVAPKEKNGKQGKPDGDYNKTLKENYEYGEGEKMVYDHAIYPALINDDINDIEIEYGFDDFDVAEAIYVYVMDYNEDIDYIHNLKNILSHNRFRARPSLRTSEDLEDDGLKVYKALEKYYDDRNSNTHTNQGGESISDVNEQIKRTLAKSRLIKESTEDQSSTYYKDQLSKLDVDSEYSPTIQIKDGNGAQTKWLDLNKESAKELMKWLKQNF